MNGAKINAVKTVRANSLISNHKIEDYDTVCSAGSARNVID
jgi:hypothetical protein